MTDSSVLTLKSKKSDQNVIAGPQSVRFKTRIKLAKETFLEWSSRTDMNNYKKIFEYKGNIWAQIIWIIIFLVLTGLTVVLIQQSISAYLTYSVTSTYETIYQSPLEFPTITVCSSNPFLTNNAVCLFYELANIYNVNTSSIKELIKLAKMHAANPSYGDENRKKLGLSFNDIISCQFNSKDCKNDLHWIWLYDYGNCFQFNSGLNFTNHKIDLVKSSRLDKGYGLKLNFGGFYSNYDQIEFKNNDIVVLVHNKSSIISSSTKLSHIHIYDKLALSLKITLISKQPSPYSDCIDLSTYSSVLYDYLLQSNYSYRQIDCLDLCIQQKIINECECYYLKYPDLNTQVKPCLNWTQFNCANNEINNFDSAECIKTQCPLECTSIAFQLENSYGSGHYERSLSDFVFTALTVSYSSLKYTQITESPQTTFINLLAQLGGSLGMFISFSVFTLFESIEVLVLILFACFPRAPKVSQNSQVNQDEQNVENV